VDGSIHDDGIDADYATYYIGVVREGNAINFLPITISCNTNIKFHDHNANGVTITENVLPFLQSSALAFPF